MHSKCKSFDTDNNNLYLYPCSLNYLPDICLSSPGGFASSPLFSDLVPQLDGNLSLMSPLANSSSNASKPNPSVRRAPFNLNKAKQLSKIHSDTFLKDFKITVSPSQTNVNIQCSTGFYTQAVLPSFCGITKGTIFNAACFTVYCHNLVGRVDNTDADVNAVLKFLISKASGKSIGGVTMHLHHTTRKVQVQGSAIVGGQIKAAVWFVENVVKERLSMLSRTKSTDISKFNDAVREMMNKHNAKVNVQEPCSGCNSHFNGRSVPQECSTCNHKYHKSKCFMSTNHPCHAREQQTVDSSQASALLNQAGSLQAQGITQSIPNDQAARAAHSTSQPDKCFGSGSVALNPTAPPFVSSSRMSSSSINNPYQQPTSMTDTEPQPFVPPGQRSNVCHNQEPQVIRRQPQLETSIPVLTDVNEITSQSQLPTSAQLQLAASPTAPPSITEQMPAQPKTSKRSKKNNKDPSIDKDKIDLEYAQIEINTVKAKLQAQENKISELEHRNAILMERNKVLEQTKRDHIYDQYFPSPPSSKSSLPSKTCPCSPPSCHCCTAHSCRGPHHIQHCGVNNICRNHPDIVAQTVL